MKYPPLMDQIVPKHGDFATANSDSVIVTLFRCKRGYIRGWYVGPPSFSPDVPMSWHTSPEDLLLGPVALVRAMDIAQKLGTGVSVVDPDGLWNELHGRSPRPADPDS